MAVGFGGAQGKRDVAEVTMETRPRKIPRLIPRCYGLIWIESKPEHKNRLIIAQLALLGGSELAENYLLPKP